MKVLIACAIVLLAGISAEAQVSCFSSGPSGQFLSCDGPRGQHTDQLQLNRNQGVITDNHGSVQPYVILPAQPQGRVDRGVVPLQTLQPLQPLQPVQPVMPTMPVFLYGEGQ